MGRRWGLIILVRSKWHRCIPKTRRVNSCDDVLVKIGDYYYYSFICLVPERIILTPSKGTPRCHST